jgi:AbrB family looped-hinge helix DNA binding protein
MCPVQTVTHVSGRSNIGKTNSLRSLRVHLDTGHTIWYYINIKVMEAHMESAITVKGQATIPKAIREYLRLKPGDRVKFFVHPDGSVVLLPKLSAAALRGIIKSRRRRPVTIEEMTEAAGEGAASAGPRAGRR